MPDEQLAKLYNDRYNLARELEKDKCERLVKTSPAKLVEISRAYIKLFALEDHYLK